MNEGILEFVNVGKEYSGHAVLKNINMSVRPGEIHALIGENGAGKSTLMNILFGMPVIHSTGGFTGEVRIGGKNAGILTPHDAMENGIGMVHQEFMLIPGFTITENIKLNREITKPTLMSKVFGKRLESLEKDNMARDARKALDVMGMDIEEYVQVEGLPVGHLQFVEIAREIDKTGIKFLVFDEPTAVLTESETENLLDAIRKLAKQGIGIIFISHRLEEIIRVSDRVTILRDGEWVATENTKDITAKEIARLMVGRALSLDRVEGNRQISDEILLDVKGLRVMMPGEEVKDVSLSVRKGEIVGIGGLAGQGKLGIANGLMGLYPVDGTVTYKGEPLDVTRTDTTLKKGIAFLSEDRKGVGLLLDSPIDLNIAFSGMEVKGDFFRRVGPFKRHPQARRGHGQGAGYPLYLRGPVHRGPVRRQPAEGVHRPGPDAGPGSAAGVRAHPRHRHRREEADLGPAEEPGGGEGHDHRHDQLRAGRAAQHLRPDHHHLRGQGGRRAVAQRLRRGLRPDDVRRLQGRGNESGR